MENIEDWIEQAGKESEFLKSPGGHP